MANHKSAEKRARQTIKRTITKAVRVAVEAKDLNAANEALKVANKSIHSFVSRGFLKKQTAARRVSRLAQLVNTLKAA